MSNAILIKTHPQGFSSGRLTILASTKSSTQVGIGDDTFVWFSETQGGSGLAARGIIESISGLSNGQIELSLASVESPTAPLGNSRLAPFRNSQDERPEALLSDRIYRFSHNRIVELSDTEVTFLHSFFDR